MFVSNQKHKHMPVKKWKKDLRKQIMAKPEYRYVCPDLGDLTPEEKYLEFFQGQRLEFDFKNYPDLICFFRDNECVIQIKKSTREIRVGKEMWTTFDHIMFEEDKRTFYFIRQVLIDYFNVFLWPQVAPMRNLDNFKK